METWIDTWMSFPRYWKEWERKNSFKVIKDSLLIKLDTAKVDVTYTMWELDSAKFLGAQEFPEKCYYLPLWVGKSL